MITYTNETTYQSGHPWYYLLGGPVLPPKEIRRHVRETNYKGALRSEIEAAAKRPEPRRSDELRALREAHRATLSRDITIYREVACQLHRRRRLLQTVNIRSSYRCDDIDVSMSLKHAHIFNAFAHLDYIDELLSEQRDLFDL